MGVPVSLGGKGSGSGDGRAATAWGKACATLKKELGEDTFGSWIAQAALREGRSGRLVVVTPTGMARDWIRRNAWRRLSEIFSQNDPERRALEL